MQPPVIRCDTYTPTADVYRLVNPTLGFEHFGKSLVSGDCFGIEPQRVSVDSQGFVILALEVQTYTEVFPSDDVIGLDLYRLAVHLDGFVKPAQRLERIAKIHGGRAVVGSGGNSVAKRGNR